MITLELIVPGPLPAVTMRVLAVDGREVHSAAKGGNSERGLAVAGENDGQPFVGTLIRFRPKGKPGADFRWTTIDRVLLTILILGGYKFVSSVAVYPKRDPSATKSRRPARPRELLSAFARDQRNELDRSAGVQCLAPAKRAKKKGRPKTASQIFKRSRSHAIPTGILRPWRNAAKPRPAKPRTIIAQVDGSGAEAIWLLPPSQS